MNALKRQQVGPGSRAVHGGVALAAAVLVTVWWGVAGLGTENFGSDCLVTYGEFGPRAERCAQVNDRAGEWIPRLVALAWAGAVVGLLWPDRLPAGRRGAVGLTVVCLVVAVGLGVHAVAISRP